MRRVQAILVLLAVSFSLISPLLAGPTESKLPSCCRRDGKHHCSMKGMAGAKGSSLEVHAAKSKCPLYPAGKSVPLGANLPAGLPAADSIAPVLSFAAGLEQTEARFRISHSRSCQKRGPPSLLSS